MSRNDQDSAPVAVQLTSSTNQREGTRQLKEAQPLRKSGRLAQLTVEQPAQRQTDSVAQPREVSSTAQKSSKSTEQAKKRKTVASLKTAAPAARASSKPAKQTKKRKTAASLQTVIPSIERESQPPIARHRWEEIPVPICDKEQLLLIQAILDDPEFGERIMASSRTLNAQLEEHRSINIDINGTEDTFADEIKNLPSGLPNDCKDEASSEILKVWWENDWRKCKGNNEALFQRTVMIQLIDRHRLFFHEKLNGDKFFDFSAEQDWADYPMPTRGILQSKSVEVPKMRPDLCVSFLTDSVFNKGDKNYFPDSLKELIYFEGSKRKTHSFPFLMIEAKKSYTDVLDEQAFWQCLNYASQALHILYEFLREANPRRKLDYNKELVKSKYEVEFFEKVRVFTAVATSEGLVVRIHRATEVKHGHADRITASYPLNFEHAVFATFPTVDLKPADSDSKLANRDRAEVIKVFEDIIWRYGKFLMDLLNKAGADIKKKFFLQKDLLLHRSTEIYRHEMDAKTRGSKSRSRSLATPLVGPSPKRRRQQ